jgi:hypothetical protein
MSLALILTKEFSWELCFQHFSYPLSTRQTLLNVKRPGFCFNTACKLVDTLSPVYSLTALTIKSTDSCRGSPCISKRLYVPWKPVEIASYVSNCQASFRLVNVSVFTVEIDCFCPGSPSCWHWFWGQGCTRQVLPVGCAPLFLLSRKLIYSVGGGLTLTPSATRSRPWVRQLEWNELD